jgi:hypothetical protein
MSGLARTPVRRLGLRQSTIAGLAGNHPRSVIPRRRPHVNIDIEATRRSIPSNRYQVQPTDGRTQHVLVTRSTEDRSVVRDPRLGDPIGRSPHHSVPFEVSPQTHGV